MSGEAHHLTMGNSIIGSRQITDANPGPATFNRPAQTHNSVIADVNAATRARVPPKCWTSSLYRPTA
jgi:hypothetical protein